jgi:hypothetical protein
LSRSAQIQSHSAPVLSNRTLKITPEELEAIAKGTLERMLGAASATALIYYVPIRTIASKPEEFANSLEKLLGEGSRFILTEIADGAYRRLGAVRNSDFAPAIRKLMQKK